MVEDRRLDGIDPGGWAIPGSVAADEHFPVALLDLTVMARAQQCRVVPVGEPAVQPRENVVDLAPGKWPRAARPGAAAVAEPLSRSRPAHGPDLGHRLHRSRLTTRRQPGLGVRRRRPLLLRIRRPRAATSPAAPPHSPPPGRRKVPTQRTGSASGTTGMAHTPLNVRVAPNTTVVCGD